MQGWDGPPPPARSYSQPGMFLSIYLPSLRPELNLGWRKWAFLPDCSCFPKHSAISVPSLGSPTSSSPHAGSHLSVTFSVPHI